MQKYHLISLINLWCTKNLVDSQFLLGKLLVENQVTYSTDPYDPEVELVFLNTCGFISSGREEALATVKKLLKKGKKVCITGCAVKYREDLTNSKDEERTAIKPQISIYPRNEIGQLFMTSTPRALTNIDNKFEYLKIAEGCNNACSFCIIPKIRGKQISLPIPTILQEIRNLIQQGAEEIILIAQDSTRYGTDLYGKPQLFELLEQIEQVEGNFHYRVLYLYPDLLTLHQLKKLTSFKKFIPYFDIPLQHISSSVLQRMGRFYDEQAIYTFLNFIKSEFPIHFIRTNFIIGFPWETEEDVQKLHDFIAKDYFDNIALFEYHDEPLASSFQLSDKISEKVLHSRFREIRSLINQLFLNHQQARKGKKEWGYVIGVEILSQTILTVRPWLHCPEIDEVDDILLEQVVSCEEKKIKIGSRVEYII